MSKMLPMVVATVISLGATGFILAEKRGIHIPSLPDFIGKSEPTAPTETPTKVEDNKPVSTGNSRKLQWVVPKGVEQATVKYLDASGDVVFQRSFDVTPNYSVMIEAK